MTNVVLALAPVFILIVLGWGARAGRVATAEQFGVVNRFGYFVLYPAMLFTLIADADFAGPETMPFLLGVLAGFGVMIVLALAMRLVFRGDGPAYTSVFQGAVRWNGFALLAATPMLYGEEGLALLALMFGPLVLLANVVSIGVLSRWGERRATSWRAVVDQVAMNPLIIACFAGMIAHAIGLGDLGPLTNALELLGQAAMPVSLVCVGAGLDLKALRGAGSKVGAACVLKLMVAPAVLWSMTMLMGAGPAAAAVAAGIGSTPTAAAGYTLAREMGGDARLMAAIITATTLASFFTMPIAIALTQH